MKRIFFLILLFSAGTTHPEVFTQKCSVPQKQTEPTVWMTIFVHGAIKAEWIFSSLIKVVNDSLDKSTYQKAVTVVRNDPHFFQLHAMQEQGLKKIDFNSGVSQRGAGTVAQLYDQITALAQPTPTINHYYTYGWSGLMSPTQRLDEAQQFHDALAQEIKTINSPQSTPRIRLIAYSHGGNICLNLAQAKNKQNDLCLSIDELVLIGSPVQPETDFLVADPMFKKVYNFYSPDDMVQPADFFSSKMSHRTFKPHAQFSPPSKLKQISIRVAHYTARELAKRKNALPVPMTAEYEKNGFRKNFMNPGHIELWYMGWTPSMYRNNFPLYPFPVVDFVSFITAHVDRDPTLKNNVVVTLHPQREIMELKNKHSHEKKTVPFISQETFKQLETVAYNYKPNEAYYKEHTQRTNKALDFARASRHGGVVRVQKSDGSYYKITKAAMCLH